MTTTNPLPNACRHCGKAITTSRHDGRWVHVSTGSIYCDLSAVPKAEPR